jgi:cysteine desulfurase/selenocysteine lyase
LSERATAAYEAARQKIKRFVNARSEQESFSFAVPPRRSTWLRKVMENLSQGGRRDHRLGDGTPLNIVPWQMLCEQIGARLRVIQSITTAS